MKHQSRPATKKNEAVEGRAGSAEPTSRRERIRAHKRRDDASAGWLSGKRPVLTFVGLLGILALAFHLFYYAKFTNTEAFRAYLRLNASASATILRGFGTEASASGSTIASQRFSMTVATGCDAIEPAALFLLAVAASPLPWRSKLPGMLIGGPLLLLLNFVRIVTLFYAGMWFPSVFEMVHVDLWQALFIVLAMAAWVIWAVWAIAFSNRPTHAAV